MSTATLKFIDLWHQNGSPAMTKTFQMDSGESIVNIVPTDEVMRYLTTEDTELLIGRNSVSLSWNSLGTPTGKVIMEFITKGN